MRKKPMQNNGGGGYNNQRNRPRYTQGGGGGGHQQNSGGQGRPRRNYGAAREKYLQQARDALAAGDRVLAENYLQHADHCYRMMVEEGAQRQQHQPQQQQHQQQQTEENNSSDGNVSDSGSSDEIIPTTNTGQLPAFLTATYQAEQPPAEPPAGQNWEERDA